MGISVINKRVLYSHIYQFLHINSFTSEDLFQMLNSNQDKQLFAGFTFLPSPAAPQVELQIWHIFTSARLQSIFNPALINMYIKLYLLYE